MASQQPISAFISNFRGGFRPNRFIVNGSIGSTENTTKFHILSATIPGSKINTMSIPYRGRFFKMPGNREYGAWEITVLDDVEKDSGKKLWDDFHEWSENFNSHETNLSKFTSGFGALTKENTDGKGMNNWTIKQLDIDGNISKTVVLSNCWPSKVGQIALSMDKNDELVTFPVTMQYQYINVDELK
jgi:hypothetical protein